MSSISSTESYQLRGAASTTVRSPWYSAELLTASVSHPLVLFAEKQAIIGKSVSVVLRWTSDYDFLPVCSLQIEYSSGHSIHRINFKMDSTSSYLISGLQFSHEYFVRITQQPNEQISDEHSTNEILLKTSSCHEIATNLTQCEPAPIEKVEWIDLFANTILLSWTYHIGDNDYDYYSHFVIAVRPLYSIVYEHCQLLRTQYHIAPKNIRSMIISIPDHLCTYEVQINVVDYENRTSAAVAIQTLAKSVSEESQTSSKTKYVFMIVTLFSVICAVWIVIRCLKKNSTFISAKSFKRSLNEFTSSQLQNTTKTLRTRQWLRRQSSVVTD
ncbi:hypothetical protein AB6A40_006260 [Gnathostoma spinigerum]|uniref:Fibronectin type-III domain-containing protein n=1 Tax=Gnathostoma spinigerum TaxID=75299 RepID=A0ABD6EII2_9BILA